MDPAEMFKKDVSPSFLTALNQGIHEAYKSAKMEVDRQPIGEEERYNLMPWTRRAHVESRVRDAAMVCGVETTTEKTGFWRHVVATTGRFRITQSTILDPETPLRLAGYKCRYAEEQKYLPGFEQYAPKLRECDFHFYAVVLHRGDLSADVPEFAVIRFPLADLSDYHPGMIDLSFYADPTQVEAKVPTEETDEELIPKLKTRKQTGSN